MRHAIVFVAALFAAWQLPAGAAEGLPGATVRPEAPAAATPDRAARQARREQWCAENPQQCKELRARAEQRREQCKADPEQCRKEFEARMAERFKKADADGNGALSRAEAEKGMPRTVRHFDTIDANRDGQITMQELLAARKERGRRKGSTL